MNNKGFKYETKRKKKIRLKDLLTIFTVFTVCIISVVISLLSSETGKKTSVDIVSKTENMKDINETDDISDEPKAEATLNDYTKTNDVSDEAVYEIEPDYKYEKIVSGEIIKPFSPKEVIYSKTMDDYRTHFGVDIACPTGTEILSSEKGEVKSVTYDINFGHTVCVQSGQYLIYYTSLSSDIALNEGDEIKKGQIIGKSSDSCMSEICDEPHIHIEVEKDGVKINPLDIIPIY